MTLQEAQAQANTTQKFLLGLYVERNELNQQIADAEEDNIHAQAMVSLLAQRERRGSLPLVKVTEEEITACQEVLTDGFLKED